LIWGSTKKPLRILEGHSISDLTTEEVSMSTEIEKAFNVIKKAMVDDGPGVPGSYAHS